MGAFHCPVGASYLRIAATADRKKKEKKEDFFGKSTSLWEKRARCFSLKNGSDRRHSPGGHFNKSARLLSFIIQSGF